MLKIHNSLKREKQLFVPLEAKRVRMYVCGMTVYDYCHLGHARVMVVFDLVYRWLKASGYAVTYVRNITDIDDKIIQRAAEKGETIQQLTDRFIACMHEDADALGVLRPDHEPRATEYVAAMLDLIGKLESRGLAYQAADGDVNYTVRKFPGYGKLSGKSLDDLRAGERVEVDSAKQDPLDFVLWKRAKPGEPAWPSPWGDGRPGWHIECSAMSSQLLGQHFDIHGGGQDLQFPHHENEIAQSEGGNGCTFVNYWMHNGFIDVDHVKMSKSLGNFFTVREVAEKYGYEPIRYLMLSAHYRSPFNYSVESIEQSIASLERLYNCRKHLKFAIENARGGESDYLLEGLQERHSRFIAAMDEDFNTALALGCIFELVGECYTHMAGSSKKALRGALEQLDELANVLGLLYDESKKEDVSVGAKALALIAEREIARSNRDWKRADEIRTQLKNMGFTIEDTPQGTKIDKYE